MKHKIIYLIFAIVLLLPVSGAAQTNEFIYQGKLTDSAGTAANYDFQFRLCRLEANCAGLNLLGTRTRLGVPVTNGVFSVPLDFPAASFDGAARFLEIGVKPAGSADPYTVLAPRQQITSAPYAVKSLNAENADNAAQLGGTAANQFVQTTDTRLADDRNPLPNSANYIQNTTAEQPVSNFNVSGDGTIGGTLRAGILRANSTFNIGATPVLSIAGGNNTFVGVNAGGANTGSINAFFGTSAGALNSGSSNAFFGSLSGAANTTGGNNSFFGRSAGNDNTTGRSNSFFGSFAGDANTVGDDNAFFGRSAGGANISGSSNAFFGAFAGNANTTAGSNSFFGASAGAANTTGFSNSFFGTSAGDANTTGDSNAFFGINSGAANISGNSNTFIGRGAGSANTGGSFNSFVGLNAGDANTSGISNSFFGVGAGGGSISGNNNAFVGINAGSFNRGGSNNTAIGANGDVYFSDLEFATAIGAGASVEASNTIRLGRTDGSDQVRTAGRIYANRGMQVGESGDNSSIFVYGNVNVGGNGAVNADFGSFGNLSKGGGSFKIDHPLDPLNKYLFHSFVESPDMMNIYNGNAVTDDSGEAVVVLPAYFEALNREFRYQLTVIGTFAQAMVSEEISANQFKIRTDKPNVKVSWQITGIRKDPYAEQNRIQTEVEKPEKERGTYLYPKAYEKIDEQPQKP